ncbi:hypothetical protein AAQ05_005712 [Salmonella enterica subsp. diarizonae]|nr:hypothetical protein [Salmonella enterica subsp. diarizonae]
MSAEPKGQYFYTAILQKKQRSSKKTGVTCGNRTLIISQKGYRSILLSQWRLVVAVPTLPGGPLVDLP